MLGRKSLVVGALVGVLALAGGGAVFAQIAAPSPTKAAPRTTSTTKEDTAASKAKVATGQDQTGAGGTVTKVEGGTITLQTRDGVQTVTTDANTRFLKDGNQNGSLGDIQVGIGLKAVGTKGEDGTLHATEVGFGGAAGKSPRDGPAGRGGKVVKIDGDTITVQNNGKTQTIVTDGNTRFLRVEGERGNQVEKAGSLSDIADGDNIKAGGSLDQNGSLHAKFVAYRWPKS